MECSTFVVSVCSLYSLLLTSRVTKILFMTSSISDNGTMTIKVYAKRRFPVYDTFMGEMFLSLQGLELGGGGGDTGADIGITFRSYMNTNDF
jgi:hypothetical protein